MTKYEMNYTCGDCLLYEDFKCQNRESDHYQHLLSDMHPMCDEGEREIDSD